MPEITLECQGLPCPQPVLKCKNCIESETPASIQVIVDNDPARENVSRFLGAKGYEVSSSQQGNEYTVIGVRSGECEICKVMTEEQIQTTANPDTQKICAFITTDVVGSGDDELGSRLMNNFLATLPEMGNDLWRIILVNGGVKLAVEGSECLEKLQELESSGVSILVCGTCLEFFGITDKKRIGETTNMLDVVTSLQLASKVIQTA
ncbi:sulfurtransferase-like selenium metabolism protein YedF [Salidesulfovibrio onnuriiensis]|uniref:sulfurtransferase-like selenium metabolism protein YedF n=1 Tax=Salidesulfovibrio onnuriiensis TaxID=2583823 RepID=UPI0011CA91ED|nr:sulfurtransferase-like selenium metabolism protein YedF [Salidesulfovibrio onnuriiensis]